MNTNFFTELEKMTNGVDVNIVIANQDGKLIMSFLPQPRVDDEAKKLIQPFQFKGTPQELDQHFFDQITPPLTAISQWSIDTKSFEDNLAIVKAASQQKKTEAETKKKELEKSKKDGEKSKGLLDTAKEHIKDFDYDQAQTALSKLIKLEPTNIEANELITQIRIDKGIKTAKEHMLKDNPRQAITVLTKLLQTDSSCTKAIDLLNLAKHKAGLTGDLFASTPNAEETIEKQPIETIVKPVESAETPTEETPSVQSEIIDTPIPEAKIETHIIEPIKQQESSFDKAVNSLTEQSAHIESETIVTPKEPVIHNQPKENFDWMVNNTDEEDPFAKTGENYITEFQTNNLSNN